MQGLSILLSPKIFALTLLHPLRFQLSTSAPIFFNERPFKLANIS